ncbi:hypothetical protein ACWIGW_31810 [Nocardia brasiliensis]
MNIMTRKLSTPLAVVVTTVGAMLVGAVAPAHATDEMALPERTVTLYYADGTVTTAVQRDYTKSRYAVVRAKAEAALRPGWIHVFEDENGGGEWVGWQPPAGHSNFTQIRCILCGPNKNGQSSSTWNDQVTSIRNMTGRTYWWYFDINRGGGAGHPINDTGGGYHNLPWHENDEMSSIYSG